MGSNLHWIWDSQASFLRAIQSWLFRTYNKQKEIGQRMQWLLNVLELMRIRFGLKTCH
ncbi:hypothetical protein Goklo_022348 [Gossypium klotzschianum]|uniref:Uncharacterized protein n=1 Tax=Gossypium klotzschianum TaxID=34286 RepID=A0A7J8TMG2_9ROSI|nr:hypothetical protein [Gossypium klotzschianum]